MSENPPQTRHLVSKAFSTATLKEGLALVDQQQIKEEQIEADIKVGTLMRFCSVLSVPYRSLLSLCTESQSAPVQGSCCGIDGAYKGCFD